MKLVQALGVILKKGNLGWGNGVLWIAERVEMRQREGGRAE